MTNVNFIKVEKQCGWSGWDQEQFCFCSHHFLMHGLMASIISHKKKEKVQF